MKLAALVLVCVAGVAAAQPSGGSVGGGDFGGGGGDSGGGGADGGGIGDSPGGPVSPASLRGILLLGGAGLALGGLALFTRPRPRSVVLSDRGPRLHLHRLRVALAPDARAAATSALRALGRTADASTPVGRAALVADVALLLRRHARIAAYAATDSETADTRRDARAIFARHTRDARALFTDERIRNADGEISEPVPAASSAPRHAASCDPIFDASDASAPGAGFTVVTLLLATRDELFEPVIDRASFDAALGALTTVNDGVIAAEVVWMPADTDEPLSSLAVETRMPDLHRLADSLAGTLACAYCTTRFPAEDRLCPRCGAHPSTT